MMKKMMSSRGSMGWPLWGILLKSYMLGFSIGLWEDRVPKYLGALSNFFVVGNP